MVFSFSYTPKPKWQSPKTTEFKTRTKFLFWGREGRGATMMRSSHWEQFPLNPVNFSWAVHTNSPRLVDSYFVLLRRDNLPFVSCLVLRFLQLFSDKPEVFLMVSWSKESPERNMMKMAVMTTTMMIMMMITLIMMTKKHLLTRCGFGPGGDGVWRGSSSDELEFLKQLSSVIHHAGNILIRYYHHHHHQDNILIRYHHPGIILIRYHHNHNCHNWLPPKAGLVESEEAKPAHLALDWGLDAHSWNLILFIWFESCWNFI